MLHAILVSLASSVVGSLIIVGCVFVLLKIFAPHVFREATAHTPEATRVSQVRYIFADDTIVLNMMGPSKSQAMDGRISASVLANALREYELKVSALTSVNLDIPGDQTTLLADYRDYILRDSKQSEQKAPKQETANSTPEFVQ
jgi:hypothetical protein